MTKMKTLKNNRLGIRHFGSFWNCRITVIIDDGDNGLCSFAQFCSFRNISKFHTETLIFFSLLPTKSKIERFIQCLVWNTIFFLITTVVCSKYSVISNCKCLKSPFPKHLVKDFSPRASVFHHAPLARSTNKVWESFTIQVHKLQRSDFAPCQVAARDPLCKRQQ